MLNDSDKPANEVAMELGLRRNQLYKWKEQLDKRGEAAFGGRGRPKKENQSELSKLKQENNRLKEENEILKRPLCSLPRNWTEIRFYSVSEQRTQGCAFMQKKKGR